MELLQIGIIIVFVVCVAYFVLTPNNSKNNSEKKNSNDANALKSLEDRGASLIHNLTLINAKDVKVKKMQTLKSDIDLYRKDLLVFFKKTVKKNENDKYDVETLDSETAKELLTFVFSNKDLENSKRFVNSKWYAQNKNNFSNLATTVNLLYSDKNTPKLFTQLKIRELSTEIEKFFESMEDDKESFHVNENLKLKLDKNKNSKDVVDVNTALEIEEAKKLKLKVHELLEMLKITITGDATKKTWYNENIWTNFVKNINNLNSLSLITGENFKNSVEKIMTLQKFYETARKMALVKKLEDLMRPGIKKRIEKIKEEMLKHKYESVKKGVIAQVPELSLEKQIVLDRKRQNLYDEYFRVANKRFSRMDFIQRKFTIRSPGLKQITQGKQEEIKPYDFEDKRMPKSLRALIDGSQLTKIQDEKTYAQRELDTINAIKNPTQQNLQDKQMNEEKIKKADQQIDQYNKMLPQLKPLVMKILDKIKTQNQMYKDFMKNDKEYQKWNNMLGNDLYNIKGIFRSKIEELDQMDMFCLPNVQLHANTHLSLTSWTDMRDFLPETPESFEDQKKISKKLLEATNKNSDKQLMVKHAIYDYSNVDNYYQPKQTLVEINAEDLDMSTSLSNIDLEIQDEANIYFQYYTKLFIKYGFLNKYAIIDNLQSKLSTEFKKSSEWKFSQYQKALSGLFMQIASFPLKSGKLDFHSSNNEEDYQGDVLKMKLRMHTDEIIECLLSGSGPKGMFDFDCDIMSFYKMKAGIADRFKEFIQWFFINAKFSKEDHFSDDYLEWVEISKANKDLRDYIFKKTFGDKLEKTPYPFSVFAQTAFTTHVYDRDEQGNIKKDENLNFIYKDVPLEVDPYWRLKWMMEELDKQVKFQRDEFRKIKASDDHDGVLLTIAGFEYTILGETLPSDDISLNDGGTMLISYMDSYPHDTYMFSIASFLKDALLPALKSILVNIVLKQKKIIHLFEQDENVAFSDDNAKLLVPTKQHFIKRRESVLQVVSSDNVSTVKYEFNNAGLLFALPADNDNPDGYKKEDVSFKIEQLTGKDAVVVDKNNNSMFRYKITFDINKPELTFKKRMFTIGDGDLKMGMPMFIYFETGKRHIAYTTNKITEGELYVVSPTLIPPTQKITLKLYFSATKATNAMGGSSGGGDPTSRLCAAVGNLAHKTSGSNPRLYRYDDLKRVWLPPNMSDRMMKSIDYIKNPFFLEGFEDDCRNPDGNKYQQKKDTGEAAFDVKKYAASCAKANKSFAHPYTFFQDNDPSKAFLSDKWRKFVMKDMQYEKSGKMYPVCNKSLIDRLPESCKSEFIKKVGEDCGKCLADNGQNSCEDASKCSRKKDYGFYDACLNTGALEKFDGTEFFDNFKSTKTCKKPGKPAKFGCTSCLRTVKSKAQAKDKCVSQGCPACMFDEPSTGQRAIAQRNNMYGELSYDQEEYEKFASTCSGLFGDECDVAQRYYYNR